MSEPSRVLLVAGITGGGVTLDPLARLLAKSGAVVTVAPAPLFRTGSVEREALRLRLDLLRMPEGSTVFGYSMGGLIAAVALDDPKVARRVRRLVTYGTPFNGTLLGWPGVALISRIAGILADPRRAWSFLSMNGTRDLIAPFPQRNVPTGSEMEVPYGHLDLVLKTTLQRLISRRILEGE